MLFFNENDSMRSTELTKNTTTMQDILFVDSSCTVILRGRMKHFQRINPEIPKDIKIIVKTLPRIVCELAYSELSASYRMRKQKPKNIHVTKINAS